MSIKANNLTEIAGLKAGQRVIQVDGKWVAVGVGCKPGGGESEPVDLSFVTATADKILTGYTGVDNQGNEVPGTMPISTVTETSEKVTVTKGYLSENKEFAVSSGGGTDTSDLPQLELSDLMISEAILAIEGPAQVPEITGFDIRSISGVGDLAAENIAYGKTICGIKGTHGGSIPGNQNNYVMPDDFTENIKLVFWKNYAPVKEITMLYTSGSGNSRVWRSSVAEPYWEIYNSSGDLWLLYYSVFPTATNSKLQKHGWSYGDSTTADDGTAFDFISLEDSTWISGPIASTPV